MTLAQRIEETIRTIPDFPKPGISFKDITPVLMDPNLCRDITDAIADHFKNEDINVVLGVESRGFLFGMLVAQQLDVPFVTVRKKGKLPYTTVSYRYDLEYGSAEIEMHVDAVNPGDRVLIHDDLLATGGTAIAASELVLGQGASIGGYSFLVELSFLHGHERLKAYSGNIHNLVRY